MPNGLGAITPAAGAGIWGQTQGLPRPASYSGNAPIVAMPTDTAWVRRYGLGVPSSLDHLVIRQPSPRTGRSSPPPGLGGVVSPGAARDRAAAAHQIVVSAQTQLQQYARWTRTMEGRAYQAWRTAQLKLPENLRTTGNWGREWGLDGVLRGNKPRMVWSNVGAGLVWRYRCNVFATNHTYSAGFAVPVVTTPNAMVTYYRAEVAGKRRVAETERMSRYFDEVPFDQVQPGDWVFVGNRKNGVVDYPHVVLAAGTLQGGNLRIAQAGSNPKPEETLYRVRNGKIEAVGDNGHVSVRYTNVVVLRPKLLRPVGPDGRRARSPRGLPD